jgi:hypothetical protein
MIALVTYIKVSAFEREEITRVLYRDAIHSGVPGIMSTETRKKKLAEEG